MEEIVDLAPLYMLIRFFPFWPFLWAEGTRAVKAMENLKRRGGGNPMDVSVKKIGCELF